MQAREIDVYLETKTLFSLPYSLSALGQVVGPKVERIWSPENEADDKTTSVTSDQILLGLKSLSCSPLWSPAAVDTDLMPC